MNSIKKEEFYEDSRLREICDNLDNSKRSLDDTFQFQCDKLANAVSIVRIS